MPKDGYGIAVRPRIYIDIIQYARVLGAVDYYENTNALTDSVQDPSLAWDFNPTKMTSYVVTNSGEWSSFKVYFKHYNTDKNFQLRRLLSTTNYSMILGFDSTGITGGDSQYSYAKYFYKDNNWLVEQPPINRQVIVGTEGTSNNLAYADALGYAIQHYDGFEDADNGMGYGFLQYSFKNTLSGNDNFQVGDILKIGTFSVGRYMDLVPQNTNLSMTLGYSYDGVSTKKTKGGSHLTQYRYSKKNWGDFPPWTHIDLNNHLDLAEALKTEDYRQVSFRGRRSWDIAFSFVSKEKIFPSSFEGNMAGNYSSQEELGTNLIADGTFDGTSGWNPDPNTGGWAVGSGVASCDGTQSTTVYLASIPSNIAHDTQYKIEFELTSSDGNFMFELGGNGSTISYIGDTGGATIKYTYYLENLGGSNSFNLRGDEDFNGSVDNVVVREVITPSGTWFDSNEGTHTDNLVGNFLTFSMSGQIPFIFQPNKEVASDFAICKIDRGSLTITEKAPELYEFKARFVEVM